MMKFVAAGFAAFLMILAGVALTADNAVQAGFPNCFDNLDDDQDGLIDILDPECAQVTPTPSPAPTDTPTPAPSGTATPTAAPTGTGTAAATGTGTATPTPSRLPAAAPQTGGNPGSGSDILLLTLILGGAAIIGVGGVFASKYALDRRS